MASTIKVNTLDTQTGTELALAATKKITGDNTQFKITGGASSNVLITDGAGALTWGSVAAGFHNVKFITATDTSVDLETGTIKILIEVLGAGGCSGGSEGSGYMGGTGGAGGYSIQQLTVVDTDTWNVTIGAGGVDGATRNGGDTVFAQDSGSSLSLTITAGGGVGALDPPATWGSGGAGGTITNANSGNKLNIVGATGSQGSSSGNAGRDTRWGFGGSRGLISTGVGGNATGYGASGGDPSGVSQLGGEGGDGLVIIWEYK